jgi:hypothetical protein
MSPTIRHQAGAAIRSVADILAFIETKEIFEEDFLIRFYAKSWTLPDGKKTGTVSACAEGQRTGDTLPITIPTCFGFQASLPDDTALSIAPIGDLNGAVASPDGLVRLARTKSQPNDLLVKNVRFLPAPFDCSFSSIEHAVVRYAIEHLGVEDLCYREIAPDQLPGLRCIDYRLVSKIQITSQKRVLNYVEDRFKEVLGSDGLTPDMWNEYQVWKARGSLRSAIARTLQRSGLQQSRKS